MVVKIKYSYEIGIKVTIKFINDITLSILIISVVKWQERKNNYFQGEKNQ